MSANPQFSNVAELFDAWLTEHDRQLLAKTETEAGKRISSELKLEHASDAHARTEPSRAYIQGCKAARSLLEDAIRDMTPVPTDGNWMETKTTTVRNTGI